MRALLLAGMGREGVIERLAIDILGVGRQMRRTEAGKPSFVGYGMATSALLIIMPITGGHLFEASQEDRYENVPILKISK